MSGLRFYFSIRSPSATERTGTILQVDEVGVLLRERRAHSKRYDQELIPHARVRAYGEGVEDDTDWVVVSDSDTEITAIEGTSWKPGPPGYVEVQTKDGPVFLANGTFVATAEEPTKHVAAKRSKTAHGTPAPQKRRSGHTHKREPQGEF